MLHDFAQRKCDIKSEALLECWPSIVAKLSNIKNTDFSKELILKQWSDEISCFLVLLKALQRCQTGRKKSTNIAPSFDNTVEKLVVFRMVSKLLEPPRVHLKKKIRVRLRTAV